MATTPVTNGCFGVFCRYPDLCNQIGGVATEKKAAEEEKEEKEKKDGAGWQGGKRWRAFLHTNINVLVVYAAKKGELFALRLLWSRHRQHNHGGGGGGGTIDVAATTMKVLSSLVSWNLP